MPPLRGHLPVGLPMAWVVHPLVAGCGARSHRLKKLWLEEFLLFPPSKSSLSEFSDISF